MSPRLRSLIVFLLGGAALAFAADAVARSPNLLVPRDFLEYWAAGRVNLRGGDPYHPAELLAEQKLADPAREHAVMMWNPPPALAVYMPLGALPPRWATLLWVGLQLAAVFVACDWLWRIYCPSHRWLAAVVGFAFVGTWWLVAYGQNTGFLLLGLAGFLHFRRKGMPWTAGAFAALTALKPHLLACFGVLLVADAVTRRGAKSLASGVAAIAVALGIVYAANPNAVAQFLEATRHPVEGATPLSDWALPVPSYWLRMWLAPDRFWVQFVPCAIACAGFLAHRVWKGKGWDWSRELPLAVAASVIATPYGGWIFDLPVLLVPAVWAAARLASAGRWKLLAALVAGQAGVTAASLEWAGGLHAYWWVAPAVLALCVPALLTPRPEPRGGADRSIH
jgi:hypothetical protein